MTSSNVTFSTSLAFCAGNSPVIGEFRSQRPVTRSFDGFFDLHLNECLCKQSWGWWFETSSHSLGRHCNAYMKNTPTISSSTFQILLNPLRPRLNRRPFTDDIFENENEWILPRISLKFAPKVRIKNIPALVQIMAWRRPGDKPLSEPMMVSSLTNICVARPQWVWMDGHIT